MGLHSTALYFYLYAASITWFQLLSSLTLLSQDHFDYPGLA